MIETPTEVYMLDELRTEIIRLLTSKRIVVYGTDNFITYFEKEIMKIEENLYLPKESSILDIQTYRKRIEIRRSLRFTIDEFNRVLMLTNVIGLYNKRNICVYAVLSRKKENPYFKESCIKLIDIILPVLKFRTIFLKKGTDKEILVQLSRKLDLLVANLLDNFEIKPICNITQNLANFYHTLKSIIENLRIKDN
ncbi:MAG: hypothetical protein ACFFDN_45400 [Candidatus Hodarchaeota archaeon]